MRALRRARPLCRPPRAHSLSLDSFFSLSLSLSLDRSARSYLIIGFGIPVYCVIARYNLAASNRVSPAGATLLGVALPWCTAWFLYQGSLAMHFQAWSGIIVNGFVAFIAPVAVSLVAAVYTLSVAGVMKALRAAPREPPNSVLDPLPKMLRAYQSNIIGFLTVIMPILIVAVFVYQVKGDA